MEPARGKQRDYIFGALSHICDRQRFIDKSKIFRPRILECGIFGG